MQRALRPLDSAIHALPLQSPGLPEVTSSQQLMLKRMREKAKENQVPIEFGEMKLETSKKQDRTSTAFYRVESLIELLESELARFGHTIETFEFEPLGCVSGVSRWLPPLLPSHPTARGVQRFC